MGRALRGRTSADETDRRYIGVVRRWAISLAFLPLLTLPGCNRADSAEGPAVTAETGEPPSATAATAATPAVRGPRFLVAPADVPVAEHMATQVEEADAAGEDILLYVGAEWCEPCQAFHDAVEAGELDEALPNLRLIEYDLDADADRLKAADYASKFIPLFAVPGPDGFSSGRQAEGAIKGEGAVNYILKQLVPLIENGRKIRKPGG